MANVYFKPLPPHASSAEVAAAARQLLELFIERESISLDSSIPLKVHFGEKRNRTFLPPENYAGILDFLRERGIESCYIETSVLYGGERFERERHIRLAHEHGFTQLPVVIADGARGEEDVAVPVNLHHFSSCHIARLLAEADQVLVLSHFKGHMLAGFGGALKQLSMGFASKGGKMAMHMGVKPRIRCWKCRRCGACLSRCNEGAITLGDHPHIDHAKCVGCGACFSICPHRAISILSFGGLWNALFGGRFFREKLAEYACASSRGKRHIYLNFALNITKGCDCEPHAMTPVLPDIGLFLSSDPVAVDAACWDAAARLGKSFRGRDILAYAEKCGAGSTRYELIQC